MPQDGYRDKAAQQCENSQTSGITGVSSDMILAIFINVP